MATTITVAGNLNISPFVIFSQDVDEVIMLLNYYLELGSGKNNVTKSKNNTRVKVNDKTATGGWW